jgi:HlyD family secretion protein
MGAPVILQDTAGAAFGTGALAINKPMAVSAFGGTVRDVRVQEGDTVLQRSVLFTLDNAPNSLEMESLRMQREAAADALADAIDQREHLIITAPADGVVATFNIAVSDTLQSGVNLLSVLEGEGMILTISVDELDVVSVAVGQNVRIAIDALPSLSLTGTVENIAPVGSGSNGVSTYDVTLNFSSVGTGVKPGMNASGAIQVARAENVVYVPVEAVMTIGNQEYVMVSGAVDVQPQASAAVNALANADTETLRGAIGSLDEETRQQMIDAFTAGGGTVPQGGQNNGNWGGGNARTGQGQNGQGATNRSTTAAITNVGDTTVSQTLGTTTTEGTLRPVTTGLRNDNFVEITSGLAMGEVVLYQLAGTSSSSGSIMSMFGGMRP